MFARLREVLSKVLLPEVMQKAHARAQVAGRSNSMHMCCTRAHAAGCCGKRHAILLHWWWQRILVNGSMYSILVKRTLAGSCLLGSGMWKEWPSRVYMDAWSMSCMA
jgi:hypothetical protein